MLVFLNSSQLCVCVLARKVCVIWHVPGKQLTRRNKAGIIKMIFLVLFFCVF